MESICQVSQHLFCQWQLFDRKESATFFLVPVVDQCTCNHLVEFDTALGQCSLTALNERQDGKHQWIESQALDAGAIREGRQQLLALYGSEPVGLFLLLPTQFLSAL